MTILYKEKDTYADNKLTRLELKKIMMEYMCDNSTSKERFPKQTKNKKKTSITMNENDIVI